MTPIRYAIVLCLLPLFAITTHAQQAIKNSKLAATAAPSASAKKVTPAASDARHWNWSSGLGIYVAKIDNVLAKDLRLKAAKGFYVFSVASDGPAYKAGVRPGDLLVGLAPTDLWSTEGKTGGLLIIRNGKPHKLNVTSGKVVFGKKLTWRSDGGKKGKTLLVGSARSGQFRTITAAAISAHVGDTIVLKSGTYQEAIMLPPGVNVRAQETSVARIEAKSWMLVDGDNSEIRGLTFVGGGIALVNSNRITVAECEFRVEEKQTGISILNSKQAILKQTTIRGAKNSSGISAVNSGFSLQDSKILEHGNAIRISNGAKADIRNNLIERNSIAVNALQSDVIAANNIIGGLWDPDSKADNLDIGIRLVGGTGSLTGNTIRRHRYGIFVSSASAPVNITESTVTQGLYGIVVLSGPAMINSNLIMQNAKNGIYVTRASSEQDRKAHAINITRNTISENKSDGVTIKDFETVTLAENLIEGNYSGIRLEKATAEIDNNTIVAQRSVGINVRARSDIKLFNNIVAFNKFGVFVDVTARHAGGFNNVYSNLASTEFPLRDGNYGVTDRYVTRDGKKVLMDIYPRYDIKDPTDTSVDPKFVALGSDYSLQSSSPLVKMKGQGQRYIGAYPPP